MLRHVNDEEHLSYYIKCVEENCDWKCRQFKNIKWHVKTEHPDKMDVVDEIVYNGRMNP